jgi:serine/threonine-protein kinase HipA
MNVDVRAGDKAIRLGTLRFDANGNKEAVAFEYDDAWLSDKRSFAIDPLLPLQAGPFYRTRPRARAHASVFFGVIADAEPEGWGRQVIRRDWAKQEEAAKVETPSGITDHLNSLDYLLCVNDISRVGALRFCIGDGDFLRAADPGERNAPPLLELNDLIKASQRVETDEATAADLRYLRGKGTSLGGLRPKASVMDEDGTMAIAKFPSVQDDRDVTRGEILALRLARLAGIETPNARVALAGGTPVALITRFDRVPDGRLMFASAMTMLGIDDDDDHTYTEIADAIRLNAASPAADLEELWRRMVFSVLVTNTDDHLKNHGFLHVESGQWRLSPAYDINPTPDKARELKTWISEEAGPEASIDSALLAAPYFGIAAVRAKEIAAEVEAAVSRWRDVGAELGMSRADLDKFGPAFEHKERALAKS